MALDSNTLGLVTNLGIGAAIFIAVLLLFDVLRYYLPTTYYYREAAAKDPRHRNYDGSPILALPRPSHRPLSWVLPTLRYTEAATIHTHGLDVAMYIRFLATQTKIFFVLTIFTAIVLYPTYITASNKDLPEDEPNRAVGIEIASLANVPDKSNRLWVTLFSEIVIVATVLIFLYRDIVRYTALRRVYRSDALRNPSNYAVIVQDIPEQSRTLPKIYRLFDSLLPGQVAAVHQVRDAETLFKLKRNYYIAITRRERAEWEFATSDQSLQSSRDLTSEPVPDQIDIESNVVETEVKVTVKTDPLTYWRQEQAARRNVVLEKEDFLDENAPLTGAAIIVFTSKRAATVAATAPIWSNIGEWKVSRAAEPRGVNWNRLDISRWTTTIRAYVSFAALTALALFWTIPAGLIQACTSLKEVSKELEFLQGFVKGNPGFVRFLEGVLPPLLLFVALLLIPLIVRFVVSFERIHSRPIMEGKIRNYLFLFYIMSNFIYVVIIGSITKKLKAIIDNPTTIISLLSTSVPGQASFLMKYVLVNAFLGSTVGMLNVGRLLFRPFVMYNTRTEREKRNGDGLFAQYPFSKLYALCAMISLISLVYSTIAPLICLVALVYYCIAYLCTKQLLLYSHRPLFEGGGYLFRDAWTQLLIGLYVHQVSMIGIFGLKRALPQAILAGLSFIATIWFTLYCRNKFWYRSKHGSLIDQLKSDEECELQDRIPDGFADMYIHPGLKPLEEFETVVADASQDLSPRKKKKETLS